MKTINLMFVLNICSIAYLANDIQEIIYSNKLGVKARLNIMNFIGVVVYLFWVVEHYTDYTVNYTEKEFLNQDANILNTLYNRASFEVKYFVAILTTIQFLRILYQMKVNRTFGPMVKILTLMIWNLIIYIALMGTIFFIFCCIGQLLFQELPNFRSIPETSKYLFGALVGNFAFENFNALDEVAPEVGFIYI